MSNFMKICPVGADFFPMHTDRQTDIQDEVNSLFCSFAKAPKN